jgi:hypothetical protein
MKIQPNNAEHDIVNNKEQYERASTTQRLLALLMCMPNAK